MDQRLSYIPNVSPMATWDFTARQLPNTSMFFRSTSAYGLMKGRLDNTSYGGGVWPVNGARFSSNPWTGENVGIMLECASTNLVPYSSDSNGWTFYGCNRIAPANSVFDGIYRHGAVIPSPGNQNEGGPICVMTWGFTMAAGSACTVSFIVERDTVASSGGPINWVLLQLRNVLPGGNSANVRFDMRNGNWANWGGAPDSVVVQPLYVVSEGKNVWRVSMTFNSVIGGTMNPAVYPMMDDGTLTGSLANRSFCLAHVQAEALRHPTSPILTTSTSGAVTRAADQLQLFYSHYHGNGLSAVIEYASRFGYDGPLFSAMNENGSPYNQVARSGNAISLNQSGTVTTNELNGVIPQGAGFTLGVNMGVNPAVAINGSSVGPKAGTSGGSTRWGAQINYFSPAGAMDPFGVVTVGSQVIKSVRVYQGEFTTAQLEALTK
ncbi:hypothetical protein [Delftia phage PhiW-14]|uniref:Uncharacterized protein n=1 Tax=Delftia phage PhiW-14 TaxID=665032 RepID=C9DG31_BPW14|nr:tail protein [Delftia phage PhiW-14]ACV50082.1 hypothetical protein [Delftia phage PhiW-14]